MYLPSFQSRSAQDKSSWHEYPSFGVEMQRFWPSNLRYYKMMRRAVDRKFKSLTQLYSHCLLFKIVSWSWVMDRDADITHNRWYPRPIVGQRLRRWFSTRCSARIINVLTRGRQNDATPTELFTFHRVCVLHCFWCMLDSYKGTWEKRKSVILRCRSNSAQDVRERVHSHDFHESFFRSVLQRIFACYSSL